MFLCRLMPVSLSGFFVIGNTLYVIIGLDPIICCYNNRIAISMAMAGRKKKKMQEIDDGENLYENFSVFWEDEKTADVVFGERTAHITRYTTHPAKQIFAKDEMPLFQVGEVLLLRCWDKNRDNLQKYLDKLGLDEFNQYKICRKTHGVMYQDKIWFKYEGENLCWDDVRCI